LQFIYPVWNLEPDFKYAEETIKRGSKTFYFASGFMPRTIRNHFYSIYSFCRHTDNLIDDNDGNVSGQRLLISEWKANFLDAYRTGKSKDRILNTFVHTMKKFRIPVSLPLDLIKGVSMDIWKKSYQTFNELKLYCYRVASVVGLMLMHVMGIRNLAQAKPYAIKLGMAMQLTNILRDVGEDAKMGRVYFPKDELAKFNINFDDILHLRKVTNLGAFLQFQINRAKKLYFEALEGLKMISQEIRFVVSMAMLLYREILYVIEENKYEVYNTRAYVTTFRKILLALRAGIFGVPSIVTC